MFFITEGKKEAYVNFNNDDKIIIADKDTTITNDIFLQKESEMLIDKNNNSTKIRANSDSNITNKKI